MIDYSALFPVEPIVGWSTTNYNDRSKNGEVHQYQGFKGCMLNGERFPADYYNQDEIAVPEGRFHTSEDFFRPTPELAISHAMDHVRRLNDEAIRIYASARRVQKERL